MDRITTMMTQHAILTDLTDISTQLSQTQQRLASGKQITKPSDDPFAAGQAIGLSGDLASTQQYQKNVGEATAWQNVTDTALSNVSSSLQRARELAIQGASDSAGPSAKNAAAQEIDQLIESIKQEADASYAGRYVFAGTASQTKPYAVGGPDTYAGDAGTVAREIGPGVSVQVNVVGSSLLGSGQGAADGKILDTLRNISQHLKSGTVADANSLRTTDLKSLDTNLDAVTQARATVGATTNRLTTADGRLQDVALSTTTLLSNVQDADMAKTMTDFSMQQAVYQAALRAGSNIIQTSLLDFLK